VREEKAQETKESRSRGGKTLGYRAKENREDRRGKKGKIRTTPWQMQRRRQHSRQEQEKRAQQQKTERGED